MSLDFFYFKMINRLIENDNVSHFQGCSDRPISVLVLPVILDVTRTSHGFLKDKKLLEWNINQPCGL